MLHGSDKKTSSGAEFTHLFKFFVFAGFKPVAIDMPGYGKSPGKVQSFRSSEVWAEHGPGILVLEIIRLLDASELVLFGYDWGGCIALRVGALPVLIPSLSKLISFMPTYVERLEYRNELAHIPIPTLILWDKNNTVRNYRQSCVVNGQVGCRMLHLLDLRNAIATSVYRKHSNEVAQAIAIFLLGHNPSDPPPIIKKN